MEIRAEQIHKLNEKEISHAKYILYLMQQSQRAVDNPALDYAINQANDLKLPLVTLFVLTNEFPDANLRHYTFMLEGLSETAKELQKLNVSFKLCLGNMVETVVRIAQNAAQLITDKGYLRIQRSWRAEIANRVSCSMLEIEGDVLFPVEMVINKEAFNAKSIRNRIYKFLPFYNISITKPLKAKFSFDTKSEHELSKLLYGLKVINPDELAEFKKTEGELAEFIKKVDATVAPSAYFSGGYRQARKFLANFVDNLMSSYFEKRSDPGEDCQTCLSPYLHFGQISIREVLYHVLKTIELADAEFLEIVLKTKPGLHQDSRINGALELFEEAIVRRELSMNYCHFNHDYDQYSTLPDWARKTLREHVSDDREKTYYPAELEQAETHDVYWNAAQKEMVLTGKMHGYMRMYWGKKIIEWCAEPEEAFQMALYLNNKYELDGRDPNGFAGVAWCFGKHDRAWSSFPVVGNVRVMKATGLKRKFNMQKYINRVEHL